MNHQHDKDFLYQQQLFFTADILFCQSRKITDGTNDTNKDLMAL